MGSRIRCVLIIVLTVTMPVLAFGQPTSSHEREAQEVTLQALKEKLAELERQKLEAEAQPAEANIRKSVAEMLQQLDRIALDADKPSAVRFDAIEAIGQVLGGFYVPGAARLEPARSASEEWKLHVDWCMRDGSAGGSVDCPASYLSTYPECWASGGRRCVMGKAKAAASAGNCQHAWELAIMCQCHDKQIALKIENAGKDAVCNYLGPPPKAAPDQRKTPPSPPPSPAATPEFQFACVLRAGEFYVAVIDQYFAGFATPDGQKDNRWIGQPIYVAPQPFRQDCANQGLGTPVGRTLIRVDAIQLSQNILGKAGTIVTGRAPK